MPQQKPIFSMAASLPSSPPTFWLPPLRPRPGSSYWPLAILISLILHGLLGWWGLRSPLVPLTVREKARVTKISFQREQPAPPVAKPLAEPMPAKPKPMAEPPLPQPAPTKEALPDPTPKPMMAEPPPAARPAAQTVPPPQPVPAADPPDHIRQNYLSRLMSHLEAHKFYPAAARRRGMEGTVHVSFTVMANGEIRQLQLAGGHKMLHQAAAETMQRSLPLPLPPREVATPLTLSYGMSFALR